MSSKERGEYMVKSSQATDTVKLKERREKNHTAVLGTGHLHNMEPAEKKPVSGERMEGHHHESFVQLASTEGSVFINICTRK